MSGGAGLFEGDAAVVVEPQTAPTVQNGVPARSPFRPVPYGPGRPDPPPAGVDRVVA